MAGKVGLRALGKIATHEGEDAVAHVAEHEEADVAERGAEREAEHAAESCALSFAPNTLVTTPSGLRFIASLKVGDKVSAYDPATGKASVQTVQHTFINHDTNLLSVTLRTVSPASASQGTTGSAVKQRDAAVAAHGAHAPPQTPADETIQTTTNHPWLTADHGWILASFLHVGEPVQRVDGSTAVVVAVRAEPGAAAMWDLTVSNVHTFAVGSGAYVVHNSDCGMLKPGPYADESIPARGPGRDFTDAERQQIDEIGQRTGCHSCGSTNPGRSGHFVPDHQPSNKLVQLLGNGEPQRLYPHCVTCSLRQGGQVNVFLRMLRNFMV